MGGCSSKQKPKNNIAFKLHRGPTQSISNLEVKIYPSSMVYNLLARNHNKKISNNSIEVEIIDLRLSNIYEKRHIEGSYNIDLEYFTNTHKDFVKELKILLDFKQCLFLGNELVVYETEIRDDLKELIKRLNESNLKVKALNILNINVDKFFDVFPFFVNGIDNVLHDLILPIMIYDNDDTYDLSNPIYKKNNLDDNKKNFKVFIQDRSRFEGYFQNKYEFLIKELGIDTILTPYRLSDEDFKSKILPNQYQNIIKKADYYELINSSNVASSQTLPTSTKNNVIFTFYGEDIKQREQQNQKGSSFYHRLIKLFKDNKSFLIIFDDGQSDNILEALENYLIKKYNMDGINVRRYIQERIPKYNIPLDLVNKEDKKDKKNKKSPKKIENQEQKSSLQNHNDLSGESRCDEIKRYLLALKDEIKNDKSNIDDLSVSDIYTLVLKIIDNMIKNINEDKYKTLNPDNEKLKNTIFRYIHSIKMIEIAGFIKDPNTNMYSNNGLDLNTMKIIKSDFELAYRLYQN